jgi:hypothetical protein
MALPELTLPDGTPAFLADGHSIELTPMYADVPMRTGHDRRRRVYTTVPRIVSVGLQVTAAQMLAFHAWFEGPLLAGVVEFSAQVANQGPGLLWWRARFVAPYTAEAGKAGASFRITARLLLTGTGSSTGPYTPNMQAAAQIALSGSVVLTAPVSLAADSVVALLPAVYLAADTVVALLPPIGRRLREDSTYRLREDGSIRLREN